MQGFVVTDHHTMEWREFDRPTPGPGAAVIRVDAVSPCTTDVHAFETDWRRAPYMIGRPFGHEMVGTVEEIGKGVRDFQPGDRVAVSAALPAAVGVESMNGQRQNHDVSYFSENDPDKAGVFVEYYLIKDADVMLAHIPEHVSMEQALMATDMMATAIAGLEVANIKFGDTVAVIGIGPVGLMAVRGAVLSGAGRIFAVGSRKVCFDVAKEYGATDFVDYHDADWKEQIIKANGGQVDKVITAGGNFSTIGEGLRIMRMGGNLTNLISFSSERGTSIPCEAWSHEKPMRSCIALGGRYHMERILKCIEYGRWQPEKIITHRFHGKEYLQEAIALFINHDRSLIKPVVYFTE